MYAWVYNLGSIRKYSKNNQKGGDSFHHHQQNQDKGQVRQTFVCACVSNIHIKIIMEKYVQTYERTDRHTFKLK